jgi:hypothetical protein
MFKDLFVECSNDDADESRDENENTSDRLADSSRYLAMNRVFCSLALAVSIL